MVDIVGLAVGIAAGLLDEALEGKQVMGYSAQDVGRFGMFVAGLIGEYVGTGTVRTVSEKLQIASIPLVVKSAKKLIAGKATYRPPATAYPTPAPARPGVTVMSY
jgi:uncharacterized membrane protein YeaQ/YmgE (transglycosylase-associated protein family)